VPIIPVYNDPSMMGGGQSDLKVAIPLQDAVNKQVLDMMVTSEAAAFPLRIGAGIEQPRDPITGELIPNPELKLSQSKFMMVPEGGSLSQLPAADLNNYVKPIEMLIQHLAAQTRTPPHYLLSSIINASGDALKAAEAGLVSKVEKKILDFSDPWEEAMRLAFLAKDDPTRGREMAAHTMWRDPEKKSLSELADYGVKLRSIGVPYEFIWPTLGFTPEDIRRMKELTGLPDRPPPGAITGDTLARQRARSTHFNPVAAWLRPFAGCSAGAIKEDPCLRTRPSRKRQPRLRRRRRPKHPARTPRRTSTE
jgi:hypothetical protein